MLVTNPGTACTMHCRHSHANVPRRLATALCTINSQHAMYGEEIAKYLKLQTPVTLSYMLESLDTLERMLHIHNRKYHSKVQIMKQANLIMQVMLLYLAKFRL